jgi:hypothetical protein
MENYYTWSRKHIYPKRNLKTSPKARKKYALQAKKSSYARIEEPIV